MPDAEILDVPNEDAVAAAADVRRNASTVSAADLEGAFAEEIGRLDEGGRRLQVLMASRMARATRREFEAWFDKARRQFLIPVPFDVRFAPMRTEAETSWSTMSLSAERSSGRLERSFLN